MGRSAFRWTDRIPTLERCRQDPFSRRERERDGSTREKKIQLSLSECIIARKKYLPLHKVYPGRGSLLRERKMRSSTPELEAL